MRVTLLILDQTNMLSLAAAVDPLRAANRQAGRALYEWHFATPTTQPVHLTSGVTLPASPLASVAQTDLLIVVAGFDIQQQATASLCASLRRLASHCEVIGIDGGPWILAKAGLLDGRRATLHWEDLEAFSQAFPQIDVVNARYVSSGGRRTCGGAGPALDMMLDFLSDQHGPALSGRVAAVFIHDPTHPALPQRRSAPNLAHNATTAKAQALMESSLDAPLSIAALARALGVSPRSLQQQFRDRLNTTPKAHYLSLRLGEAHRQVTQTQTPLFDIALATGFPTQASFSRAFKSAYHMSASQLRRS